MVLEARVAVARTSVDTGQLKGHPFYEVAAHGLADRISSSISKAMRREINATETQLSQG
jgi:hypothetical protein